jgi:hypothetical protein
MTALAWMLAIAAFFALFALVMTLINLAIYRPAPSPTPAPNPSTPDAASAAPRISVCIPARNEEANIEPCVRSILAGSLHDIEVLVYNDQSTDRTGEILSRLASQDPRIRLPPTAPLPAGWNGKQFGCDTLGRAARGQWLLFTDADVRFEPDALARTLASAQQMDVRLLSTFPRQITGTLGEILAVPMIFFILFSYLPMPRMRRTMDPSASAACGQFIFAQRDAYLASGGHAAFKDSMHDGVKMPRTFRRAGFKTDLFDGTDLCHVRMYNGLRQTWRGFAKNAFEGLGSIGLLLFITIVHALAHVLPWLVLIAAALSLAGFAHPWLDAAAAWPVWLFAALAVAANLAQRSILAARFAQSPLAVLLHPLGIIMMTAIQWHSWWLHITGRRAWKGRTGQAPPAATT